MSSSTPCFLHLVSTLVVWIISGPLVSTILPSSVDSYPIIYSLDSDSVSASLQFDFPMAPSTLLFESLVTLQCSLIPSTSCPASVTLETDTSVSPPIVTAQGLSPATAYEFQIQIPPGRLGDFESGESLTSHQNDFRVCTTVPRVVNLEVEEATSSSIKIKWEAPSFEPDQYIIYLNEDLVETVTAPGTTEYVYQANDTLILPPSTQLWCKVVASRTSTPCPSSGEEAIIPCQTDSTSGMTPDPPVVSTASPVSPVASIPWAIEHNSDSATLSLISDNPLTVKSGVELPVSCFLSLDTNPGGPTPCPAGVTFETDSSVSPPTVIARGLEPATFYNFQFDTTPLSGALSTGGDLTLPGTPVYVCTAVPHVTDLLVTEVSSSSVKLTWDLPDVAPDECRVYADDTLVATISASEKEYVFDLDNLKEMDPSFSSISQCIVVSWRNTGPCPGIGEEVSIPCTKSSAAKMMTFNLLLLLCVLNKQRLQDVIDFLLM